MKRFLLLLCVIGIQALGFANNVPQKDGRPERTKYISQFLKPGDVGLEIGVEEGIFAYHILLKHKPSKLYLVDPWEYGLQPEFEANPTPEKQNQRDKLYEKVCSYFAPFQNVEVIRMKSKDAASLFPEKYFDYVYVDGEHSYKGVARDLKHYFSKVKIGGYILGDDYGWTGIAPAVHDFLNKHPKACKFITAPPNVNTGGQYVIKRLR